MGCVNYEGGQVISLCGKVLSGKTVDKLLCDARGNPNGVLCADGSAFEADLVILGRGLPPLYLSSGLARNAPQLP
jgi:hypothetical protein